MSEVHRPLWVIWIAIAFQVAMVMIWLFVPFGFDHKSSWGLDFADLMLVGLAYALSIIVGAIVSIASREWKLLILQMAILLFLAWSVYHEVTPKEFEIESIGPAESSFSD